MTASRALQAIFFAPAAYPLGGVQTWLDYLVDGLSRHGIRSKVALCCGEQHKLEIYQAAHPDLPITPLVNPSGSRQGRINAISALLRAEQPDFAISANIVDTYSAVAQARLARPSLKTRAVMTLHGIQAEFAADVQRDRQAIDAVVTTNRLTAALVASQGFPRERAFYAPYGVPTIPDASVAGRISANLGSSDAPVRIAYVGRFDEQQKRISLIAELCRQLASASVGFEIWLAGAGPDESLLRAALAQWTANGQVRWLGHVPSAEICSRVYANVDVLINPSYWETGPIVAWEAMANGVVVVSSRYIGSGLEGALVDDVNCKLFEIGDAHGAASAIQSLCEPEARARLRAGGYQLVRARYSVDASVAAWAESLHRIAELPPRPSATINFPESGRLDRWLGVKWGERMRKLLRIRHMHTEAGAEWPHSYGRSGHSDAFWRDCEMLDRGYTHALSLRDHGVASGRRP